MALFVQYLNVGYGLFKSTKQIKKWDTDIAIGEILRFEHKNPEIKIIAFRFFEKDMEKGQIIKKSGVYYMNGIAVEHPETDSEVVAYLQKRKQDIPNFPVVKLYHPFFMLYPYKKDDCIIEVSNDGRDIEKRKKQAKIKELRQEVESYKEELVFELRKIADALEAEEFQFISLTNGDNGKKYLNLYGDLGDFGKHLQFIEGHKKEIEMLQGKKEDGSYGEE